MTAKLIRDALLFFTTIDPIGTLVLFVGLTSHLESAERRRLALRSVAYGTLILLGSVVVGQFILTSLGIRLISLQVAGGVILFIFGLQMIFGDARLKSADSGEPGHDMAVFPLAVPSIAGPGAIMAVIVATDNEIYTFGQQALTALVLLGMLALTAALMVLADRIVKIIGSHGSEILVRVMGMLLAALSVELVMEAIGVERWIGHGP